MGCVSQRSVAGSFRALFMGRYLDLKGFSLIGHRYPEQTGDVPPRSRVSRCAIVRTCFDQRAGSVGFAFSRMVEGTPRNDDQCECLQIHFENPIVRCDPPCPARTGRGFESKRLAFIAAVHSTARHSHSQRSASTSPSWAVFLLGPRTSSFPYPGRSDLHPSGIRPSIDAPTAAKRCCRFREAPYLRPLHSSSSELLRPGHSSPGSYCSMRPCRVFSKTRPSADCSYLPQLQAYSPSPPVWARNLP